MPRYARRAGAAPSLPHCRGHRGSRPLGGSSRTASLGSDGCFPPRRGASGSSLRPSAPARSLVAPIHSGMGGGSPLKALLSAFHADLPAALALGSALWIQDLADRSPDRHEVALPKPPSSRPSEYTHDDPPSSLRREYRVLPPDHRRTGRPGHRWPGRWRTEWRRSRHRTWPGPRRCECRWPRARWANNAGPSCLNPKRKLRTNSPSMC